MQSSRHRRLGPPHRPGQLPGHAERYKAGLEESVYHPQRDGLGHPPSQIPPWASSSPGASPTMRPRGLPLPGKVSSPSDPLFNRQSLPVTDPAGSRHGHSEALDEGTPLPRPLQRTLWPRLAHLGDGDLVTSGRAPLPPALLPAVIPASVPAKPPAPWPSHTPTPLIPTEVRRHQGQGGPWGEARPPCREGQ